MASFSISLIENPVVSDAFLGDVTHHFSSWRHSTKSVGGCWQGDGDYQGTPAQMENFFLSNLGKRIRVSSGGIDHWEGQIVEMELTKKGQTFTRTMLDTSNRVKVIYTKIGPNLLTNGDVESGSWFTAGLPDVAASTSSWFSAGSRAMYMLANKELQGFVPGSGISISATRPYVCSMVVNVASGVWTLEVADEATSTNIAQNSTAGCGRTWLQCQVPDNNAYTSVDVNVVSAADGDEAYFDGAFLRTAPVRSETKWHQDTDSIAAYGRIEAVILRGEMTDDEADGEALKELTDNAWPRTKPPDRGGTLSINQQPQAPGMRVTCMGLAWTLSWRHALTDGTAAASTHVASLIDESEFISSSDAQISSNSVEVYLESGNPQPLWRLIEKVSETGDGAGNPWMAGVYPGGVFRYEARPTGTQYESRGGEVTWKGGGRVPPLEFVPGYCYMVDMPEAPTPAGAADEDNPKRAWLDETWFIYDGGETRLEWTRDKKR